MLFASELISILAVLASGLPALMLGIASYVLSAMALYTIAKRRGIQSPWMAWMPVVNCWLLGSLSDQYQYVVKHHHTNRRKALLGLDILKCVLMVLVTVLAVVLTFQTAFNMVLARLLSCLALLAGVSIARAVVRYMALYDVYRSVDPKNAVVYLVLSICVGATIPFFLFFNREKEDGMPPRKQPEPCVTEETM